MDYPNYVPYLSTDYHDPDGIIFIRRFPPPIDGQGVDQPPAVSWFKAGAISLNPLELYVRMYTPDKDGLKVPTHYVRLDLVKELLNYHTFCLLHGVRARPTLDYYNEINRAVADFYEMLVNETR